MPALVLVADADPFNLRLLQESCEAAGYRVVTAADHDQALSVVARASPDLILLETESDAVDGFDVLRVLKADENLRAIPVLLATPDHDLDARSRGIELGAEDYVTTPYRVFELQHRIRTALRRADAGPGPTLTVPPEYFDPVTQTGTSTQLQLSLDYEFTRAERYGHPLTCVIVRIDNLAALRGAPASDGVDDAMSVLAAGLRQCIRAVDYLSRARPDAFCALLPETDAAGAKVVLKRVRGQMDDGSLWEGRLDPAPSLRLGAASSPAQGVDSGEALLRAATAAAGG